MASQQVMLQVRFAEVNRAALLEVGVTFFANAQRFSGRTTTQQFSGPDLDGRRRTAPRTIFTDLLNLFFFDAAKVSARVLKALQSKGYFQSLAEPNLIAYNGQEASFLAGGEFPVPDRPGRHRTRSRIAVQGVRRPPEVHGRRSPATSSACTCGPKSARSTSPTASRSQGFRIPALTTRRAETDVELRDGQSFAIAGLLNNVSQDDNVGDPDPGRAADHRLPLQEPVPSAPSRPS